MRPLRTASITPAKRKPWRSSIGARRAQSITRTPRRPTRPPSRCCYSLLARRPASQAEHEATRPTDCAETQSQRPTVRHGLVEDLYKRNTGIQSTRPTVRAHPQSQRPNASSAAAVHATLDRPAVHATEDVQNIQLSMLAGPFARPSAPSPNPNARTSDDRRSRPWQPRSCARVRRDGRTRRPQRPRSSDDTRVRSAVASAELLSDFSSALLREVCNLFRFGSQALRFDWLLL